MVRFFLLSLAALAIIPNFASAVEIKNARPCYMSLGATRFDAKYLPGDVVFLTYDIEGLGIDPKSKLTGYVTILELVDPLGKIIFKNESKLTEVMPQLGGTRMPGDLHVILGPKQGPGNYSIKLSVHDKVGKDSKAIEFKFAVLPEDFGLVGVSAPAIGFPGQRYVLGLALINLGLDAKKLPNVEVTLRILDRKGTEVAPAVQSFLPRDLPEDTDLTKANFVELPQLIYLNQTGQFLVEVIAQDKLSKKTAKVQYPLTVLDISQFLGR